MLSFCCVFLAVCLSKWVLVSDVRCLLKVQKNPLLVHAVFCCVYMVCGWALAFALVCCL